MRYQDLSDVALIRIFIRIRYTTERKWLHEFLPEFWQGLPNLVDERDRRLDYLWFEAEGRLTKKDRRLAVEFLNRHAYRWPWIQRLLDEKPIPTEGYQISIQGRKWNVTNRQLKDELAKVKDEPGEVYSYRTGVVLPISEAWELVNKK